MLFFFFKIDQTMAHVRLFVSVKRDLLTSLPQLKCVRTYISEAYLEKTRKMFRLSDGSRIYVKPEFFEENVKKQAGLPLRSTSLDYHREAIFGQKQIYDDLVQNYRERDEVNIDSMRNQRVMRALQRYEKDIFMSKPLSVKAKKISSFIQKHSRKNSYA